MKTTLTESEPCAYCGHTLNALTSATHDHPPEAGDLSICINCAKPHMLEESENYLIRRQLTAEELAELMKDKEFQDTIAAAEANVRQRVGMEDRMREFEGWLVTRPPSIQTLGRAFPPWNWYHLRTDHAPLENVYHVYAYADDGTLTLVRFSIAAGKPMWRVFGIPTTDLMPAEGGPDALRAKMTPEQVAAGVAEANRTMASLNIATGRADPLRN